MTTKRFALMVTLIIAALCGAPTWMVGAASAGIKPGVWEGSLTLPTRAELLMSVELGEDEDGRQWGRITIPDQHVVNLELADVVFTERELSFRIPESGAEFSGQPDINGALIIGVIKQAGQQMPVRLRMAQDEIPQFDPIPRVPQRWRGVANLPGVDLEFMVTFTPAPAESGWTAVIDIPLQGVSGMPLKDVVLGDNVNFTIQVDSDPAPPPARFMLRRRAADMASGSFTQAGSVFRVTLEKMDEDETVELPRPQHPKPPFPYASKEVTYFSPVDGVQLAGTLTIPVGDGPFPAVLLLTGSGPQDRDETLMGHKPFLVIADHLTRQGFAVLRMDDRGVGGSGGDTMQTPVSVNVQDAIAGVQFLMQQPRIDAANIGLLGHSEGAWVAPMAAAESNAISFIVLLAAPGVSGKELLLVQRDRVREVAGASAEQREEEKQLHLALLNAIERGAPDADVGEALRQLALAERRGSDGAEAFAEQIVKQQMGFLTSKWFRDVMSVDSRDALKKVRVPILAISGELDLQTPPDPNISEIRGVLDSVGHPNAKLVVLPGLNHLLQTARTGLPNEYLMIQQTISPEVLNIMTTWLREQAGLPPLDDADGE